MVVGVLQFELSIPDAMSLKDKRQVVRSIKDRIAHRFNVSVAEVAALDLHRTAIIGVAMVSNDTQYVQGALSKIVDYVQKMGTANLTDYQIDIL